MISAVTRAIGGEEHRTGQILDEYEIAPRFRHKAAFSILETLKENGQRPAHITGAHNIGKPERHVVKARDLQIILGSGFRDCVTAVGRILGMIEPNGLVLRFEPVAQGGLEIDESADFGPFWGLERFCPRATGTH